MNKSLSKKATLIAIISVCVFVVAGMIGAIVGNETYLDKQEAKVTNYSVTESAPLRMRNNGQLVYRYQDGTNAIDVKGILELSKGATVTVKKEIVDGKMYPKNDTVINVADSPRTFLLIQVVSASMNKKSDYILEIVSAKDYQPDAPLPIFPATGDSGILIQ